MRAGHSYIGPSAVLQNLPSKKTLRRTVVGTVITLVNMSKLHLPQVVINCKLVDWEEQLVQCLVSILTGQLMKQRLGLLTNASLLVFIAFDYRSSYRLCIPGWRLRRSGTFFAEPYEHP